MLFIYCTYLYVHMSNLVINDQFMAMEPQPLLHEEYRHVSHHSVTCIYLYTLLTKLDN